jgi:hypothetical protein
MEDTIKKSETIFNMTLPDRVRMVEWKKKIESLMTFGLSDNPGGLFIFRTPD